MGKKVSLTLVAAAWLAILTLGCGGGGGPAQETGAIEVVSTPSGAAIWLDGVDSGSRTPATLAAVGVGSHTVGLTLSGYNPWEEAVLVEANQTIPVSAILEPVSPPQVAGVSPTEWGKRCVLDQTSDRHFHRRH